MEETDTIICLKKIKIIMRLKGFNLIISIFYRLSNAE